MSLSPSLFSTQQSRLFIILSEFHLNEHTSKMQIENADLFYQELGVSCCVYFNSWFDQKGNAESHVIIFNNTITPAECVYRCNISTTEHPLYMVAHQS